MALLKDSCTFSEPLIDPSLTPCSRRMERAKTLVCRKRVGFEEGRREGRPVGLEIGWAVGRRVGLEEGCAEGCVLGRLLGR